MNRDRPSPLWRLWLLLAQGTALSAAVIIAWRSFGPAGSQGQSSLGSGVIATASRRRAMRWQVVCLAC